MGRSLPNRRVLGQRFDQGDAERPEVGGRGDQSGGGFRRNMDSRRQKGFARLAHAKKVVTRELQLIVDGHDLRWLEAAMHEALSVKIGKRIEDRFEHLSGLGGVSGRSRRICARISSAYSVTA
jgi:hypothetical protein